MEKLKIYIENIIISKIEFNILVNSFIISSIIIAILSKESDSYYLTAWDNKL